MMIPDDRVDVQTLVQAFSEYLEAKAMHDKAYNEYEGPSWGYHGATFINRVDEKAVQLGTFLDKYVDARVQIALKAAFEGENV